MARRKHIEIAGQINLFDYLVEIQQPKVVIETMANIKGQINI